MRALHHELSDFVVLGFPCNQFGKQEPGSAAEILAFVTENYAIDFPMFAKIEVNGDGAAPLYRLLREAQPNPDGTTDITWNFTKFLIDPDGEVVRRFAPKTTPEEIRAWLAPDPFTR